MKDVLGNEIKAGEDLVMNEAIEKDICAEFRKSVASKAASQIVSGMIQSKEWSFNGETSVTESFDRIYTQILKKLKND